MWTGRGICSDITADAVKKITEDFKRPPFIWWNWPVNDYCRSKILLGRTYGLDDVACSGFVSNPMENCEASKIALYGIAKWCKDPKNFDSKKVWEESFEKLYKDKKVAKAMRIFAEHNSDQGPNGHGYRREESVSAAPLCEKARNEFNASGKLSNETLEELEDLFEEILKASEYLLAELPRERYDLGWEIEGWLEAQKYQMLIAFMALDIYKKYNEGDDIKSHVSFLKEMMSHSEVLSEAYRAKFAAATFANDKQWIAKPATATRELKPLIDLILEGTLKSAYKRKTGRDFSAASGFKGFSNARAIPSPVVKLDGKYAGYVRIMEYTEIAPGESFGIQVPEKWQTDYFHAKLGDNAAVKAGVIELSKDGKIWSKLNTSNHGENMEKPLSVEDGWKFARYRNISKNKVRVKINQFKFDVRSVASPIEELIDELVK